MAGTLSHFYSPRSISSQIVTFPGDQSGEANYVLLQEIKSVLDFFFIRFCIFKNLYQRRVLLELYLQKSPARTQSWCPWMMFSREKYMIILFFTSPVISRKGRKCQRPKKSIFRFLPPQPWSSMWLPFRIRTPSFVAPVCLF